MTKSVDFYFDVGSPAAYLAWTQMPRIAAETGATVNYQPFLLGEAPGALDVLAAVVSKWSGTRQHLAQARPAFLATLQRIEQHPRVRPVFERHWPPSD